MLVLLISVFVVSTISAASPSINLNCKKIKQTTCYNNNIQISVRGMQIQQNDKNKYETLFIQEAKVEFLPMNIATAFPDLKILKVTESSLTVIEKSNFDGLNGVTELNLEKNLISILSADVFVPLENIKKINLDQNHITSLPSGIFANKTKLVSISAIGNKIRTISDEAFLNLVKLIKISISHNQIEDLYSGTFDDCVELKTISIHNNKLKYVPENIFDKNTALKVEKQHFQNNTCINEYLGSDNIETTADLKTALKDHCKPHCQNDGVKSTKNVEDLKNQLKDLNQTKIKLEGQIDQQNITLHDSKKELQECKNKSLENSVHQKMIEALTSNVTSLQTELSVKEESLNNCKKADIAHKSNIDSLNKTIEQLNFKINNQSIIADNCTKTRDIHANSIAHQFVRNLKLEEELRECKNHTEVLNSQLMNATAEMNKINNQSRDDQETIKTLSSNVTSLKSELSVKEKSLKICENNETDHMSTIDSLNKTIEQLNSTILDLSNKADNCTKTVDLFTNLFSTQAGKNQKIEKELSNLRNHSEILDKQLKDASSVIKNNEKIIKDTKKELTIKGFALDACLRAIPSNELSVNEQESQLRQEIKIFKENLMNMTTTDAGCSSVLNGTQNQNMTQVIIEQQEQLNKFKDQKSCNESSITPNPELPLSINCQIEKAEYLTCGVNDFVDTSRGIKVYEIEDNPSLKDVNGLKFTNSKLIDLPSALTKKFENFKYLMILKSMFLNFNENICEYSSKIENILVKSSMIGWSVKLDKCESLITLNIDDSGILEISSQKPIESLVKISLNGNKIQTITNEFFSKFKNLKNIQMSGNKIESLNGDVFNGNTALVNVNLSKNPIGKIDGKIFEFNKNLQTVDFRGLGCIDESVNGKSKVGKLIGNILIKCR